MRMLPNRQRRRGILAVVLLCVCFISGVAFAQTDAPFTEDMLVEAATPKAPVTALDALMIAVIALASCALLYTIYSRCLDRKEPLRRPKRVLWLLLGGALLLRLVLAAISPGHPVDINCFESWSNALAQNGLSQFYTSGMFADYPPGYMYVCLLYTS